MLSRLFSKACFFIIAIVASQQSHGAVNFEVQVNPGATAPGNAVLVELIVSNDGAGVVSNLTVDLDYPSNMSDLSNVALSAGGACAGTVVNNSACDSGEVATWAIGTLNPGQSLILSLPPAVAAGVADGTIIPWNATISDTGGQIGAASATLEVETNLALSLGIDSDNSPVDDNALLTYTMRYGNQAASSTTSTNLTFPIPVNTTFVSATGGGTFSAGEVSWSLGTLPAGGLGEQQVVVQVNNGLADGELIVVDTAEITGTNNSLPTEQRAGHFVHVGPPGPLALGLVVTPDPAEQSEILFVEMTVTNRSDATVFGATLNLHYPVGMNDQSNSALSEGGSCAATLVNNSACDSREVAQWTFGTMAPGQSKTVAFLPVVSSSIADGAIIPWRAWVTEDDDTWSSDSVSIQVGSQALTLSIDEDNDPVDTNDLLTYTVRYGNDSAASTSGVNLDFPIPEGTTFVSATGGGAESGGEVSWSLGTLAAGALGEQQVVVQVEGGLNDGDLLEVDYAQISGTNNSLPTQQRAGSVARVGAQGSLSLGLVVSPNPAEQSEVLFVEMTVTNHTNAPVFGAALNLYWPVGMADQSNNALFEGGSCFGSIVNNSACDSREIAQWAFGNLAPGQSKTVAFQPVVSSSIVSGALIPWRAWIVEDGNSWTLESDTLQVGAQALTLSIDEDNDPVDTGDLLTYTVRYGNDSAASTSALNLRFPIPDGTTFVSATGGGSLSGGEVSWSLGTLQGGALGEQQIVVQVDDGLADGDLLEVDYAEISGTNNSLPTLQRARSTARIAERGPLALALVVHPNPVEQSEVALVEMTVTNDTNATVFGATLNLHYPVGMADQSNIALSEGGSCFAALVNNSACDSREIAQWAFGNLAPGQTKTVMFQPAVLSSVDSGTLIPWRAWVVEDGNSWTFESDTVQVRSQALTLSIDEDNDPVEVNDLLTYTVRYGNDSAASTSGISLSFPIPANTTFVSATNGGTLNNGSVSWALGTLQAGDHGEQQVVVRADAGAADGELIEVDYAGISGTNNSLPTQQRAGSTAHVAPQGPLALGMVVHPNPVTISEIAYVEMTVTNRSAAAVFGATLNLAWPVGMNDQSNNALSEGGSCAATLVNNSACDSREVAQWTFGTLAPGQSRTVAFQPVVGGNLSTGTLISWRAWLEEDNNTWLQESDTVPVAGQALTLSIDEDSDPANAGGFLTYTVRYGNNSATGTTGTTLRVPIPDGTSFVSATGWPEPSSLGPPPVLVANGAVSWDLGTLPAQSLGQQQIVVRVDGGLDDGDLIEVDYAEISGTNNTLPTLQRASNVARASADGPLSLAVSVAPTPAAAAGTLDVDLSVENTTGVTVFDAELRLLYPPGVNTLGNNAVGGGGGCAATVFNNSSCDPREVVVWSLGTITPGQQIDVSLPPVVANATVDGSLIPWRATIVEDGGSWTSLHETLCIDSGGFFAGGACPSPDSDGDNVPDNVDAFPADQNEWVDTDFDGIGNNADTDDDNDGLTDDEEVAKGTDPLVFDTDGDVAIDGSDNCPIQSNPNQEDKDGDGLGDACDISHDLTTFTDVTGDSIPDVATFVGVFENRPRIAVFSGANGDLFRTSNFLNDGWQGIALSTVRDANQDGTADDPAAAMLAVNKTTRKIRVETRALANNAFLSSIQFFNENWRAVDIVIVDDLNGDGNTNDSAIAVLAERIFDGRIQLQVRDLLSGALLSNTVYLNARWTPIAAAVADRSAVAPAGTLPPLIGVIAEKAEDGRRIMQVRVAVSGVVDRNIKFLGSAWDYLDVSVNHDANSDGILDDPVWLVLASRPGDDVIRVQSRFVSTGAFDDNIVILNANWLAFHMDVALDISGNTSLEMVISAIRRSNGIRRLHIKDFASGATTINIAP